MKIAIITGSPHKNGTTALFAEKFIKGAEESGHTVFRFDAAFKKVAACTGCSACRTSGNCVFKDDMEELKPELLAADVVVFVTPLYYFGMSAQLKAVIDRFFAINGTLRSASKKAMLLAAAHDDEDWTMSALVEHYKSIVKYLKWEDAGVLAATNCGTREAAEKTGYPEQACNMGKL